MRPIATACALAVLLGAAAFAYASLTVSAELSKAPQKRKSLTVRGSVDDLQPGVPSVLRARVRNNLEHRVRLRSLKARVRDAGATCPRTLLRAQNVRTRKAIPARRTRTVPITVTLHSDAPDECQNASFPIKYRVRAALPRSAR